MSKRKLTSEDITQIHQLRKQKMTIRDIAEVMEVNPTTIHQVLHNQAYQYVEPENKRDGYCDNCGGLLKRIQVDNSKDRTNPIRHYNGMPRFCDENCNKEYWKGKLEAKSCWWQK